MTTREMKIHLRKLLMKRPHILLCHELDLICICHEEQYSYHLDFMFQFACLHLTIALCYCIIGMCTSAHLIWRTTTRDTG